MAHRQAEMKFIINTELHQLHRSPAPGEWLANLNRSRGSKPRAAAPGQGLEEERQPLKEGRQPPKASACSNERQY